MSQKLTLDKRDEWKFQINEKKLPPTFQHAIHLTRKLELKYLWVDALCIVQDCSKEEKFASESMDNVFANAHCTIATSADAHRGFFTQRNSSLLDFPCHLRFSKKKAMTIRANRLAYNSESFAEEVDRKNLNWQAHGFQERLLSRRILHFGPKFLFFECNTHIASEAITAGQPFREKQWVWERWKRQNFELQSNTVHSIFNPVNGYRNSFHQLRANRSTTLSEKEELHLHKTWFELVSRFTRCKMINISDRKVAILGLAHAIQDGEATLEYRHGLWRRHLLFDLLWFVESGKTKKPISEDRKRSWSWQAVAGEVGISHESLVMGKERSWMKVAEVISQEVDHSSDSSSGQEGTDYLVLKCPLFRCTGVFPSRNQANVLQLQTPEGGVEAKFVPDFLDFDEKNLMAAEIVRDVIIDPGRKGKGKRKIEAIGSHGIVLQRNYVDNGQGVTHERVGRFWMQWPLVREPGDSRAGSIARTILGRKSGHVVRIE
jgi:hypothetical protein